MRRIVSWDSFIFASFAIGYILVCQRFLPPNSSKKPHNEAQGFESRSQDKKQRNIGGRFEDGGEGIAQCAFFVGQCIKCVSEP